MSLVLQVKQNGSPVRGLFKKVATEGDLYRYVTAESGHSEVIHRGDTRVGKVVTGSNYLEFTLAFRYLVGMNQLNVGIVDANTGRVSPIINQAVIETSRSSGGWPGLPGGDLNPATVSVQYFTEVDYEKVRVYHLGVGDKILVFSTPHTSLQATSRSRIMVSKQGDNAIVEGLGNGDGIMLRSRSGRKGLIVIDDELGLGVIPR